MCALHDFFSGKVRLIYTSTATRSHSCYGKTTRTPRVHLVTLNFATFYFEIAVKWSKSRIFENSKWNMRQTPSKMRMNDMVTIDTIVFEIVGGGEGF